MARKFGRVALGKIALRTVAILIAGLAPLSAQQGQPRPGAQTGAPIAQAAPPPAVALPDPYKLNMMIRTAIIALNQANQTGNYTVLRDLGGASFRASNDASRLAEIFATLRKRQLDLSPVLFFLPKLLQPPQLNERGILRLVGFFETAPERINFDIYYTLEAGQWRMFGIGVLMSPAVDATAALPGGNAPAPGATSPAGQASAPDPASAAPKTAATEKTAKPVAGNAGRVAPKPVAKASAQAAAEKPAVENKTTNNTARIQLGAPSASGAAPEAATGASAASQSEIDAVKEKPKEGFLPW